MVVEVVADAVEAMEVEDQVEEEVQLSLALARAATKRCWLREAVKD